MPQRKCFPADYIHREPTSGVYHCDCVVASGNRGYRAVQLDAGAIGGRIYLAAYAEHLGATGLTFFDDDVINFFSPHAKDKSAIFLLAIGKPLKRKTQ